MGDERDDEAVYDALARLCEGKREADVRLVLDTVGVAHRVMRRDGQAGIGTRDLHRGRFNLTVVGDTVTEVRRE